MIPSRFACSWLEMTVYQRGVVIDSQLLVGVVGCDFSISKGSGD